MVDCHESYCCSNTDFYVGTWKTANPLISVRSSEKENDWSDWCCSPGILSLQLGRKNQHHIRLSLLYRCPKHSLNKGRRLTSFPLLILTCIFTSSTIKFLRFACKKQHNRTKSQQSQKQLHQKQHQSTITIMQTNARCSPVDAAVQLPGNPDRMHWFSSPTTTSLGHSYNNVTTLEYNHIRLLHT